MTKKAHNTTKQILKKALIATIILTFYTLQTNAVSIGAGPAVLNFNNMVRGGYAEDSVTVSTSGTENLTVVIESTGQIKDWVTVSTPMPMPLMAGERKNIKIVVRPPVTASPGEYSAILYIRAAPTAGIGNSTGLALGAGVGIQINVNITGREIKGYSLKAVNVKDTEVTFPIDITTLIENTGNIPLQPTFKVKILTPTGEETTAQKEFTVGTFNPGIQENYTFTLPSTGLAEGKYAASIAIKIENNETDLANLGFTLLPPGSLRLKGEFKSITLSENTIAPQKPVKITGIFQNTGEVPTNAQLTVEVYKGTELIKTIDSTETRVDAGETQLLDVTYTSEQPGDLTIRGTITYSKKKTPEKEITLIVSGGGLPTTYIAIGAAVIILIIGGVVYYKRNYAL
ncbi:Uncharacterised protein [uncultured archaeon]|nr:Uncharacterised protein [uncultured archaeon]